MEPGADICPGRPAHMHDKSNPDWAPTLKLGGRLTRSKSAKERQRPESKQNRYRRAKDRAQSKKKLRGSKDVLDPGTILDPEVWAAPVDAHEDEESVQVCDLVLQQEDDDHAEPAPVSESQADSELQRLRTEQILLKDQINDLKFNERSFENNNLKVTYYTGLPSFLMLMTVFDLVKSFIPASKVNSDLGPFECFVMTLMRLKLNLPVQDLAFRFQTSTSTVSRTFVIVIHVLYTRLKNLLYWPERDVLMKTMPLKFQKHFGQKTAVIVDCFEVFIERPKNVLAHAQTWLNYKRSNSVKFLMGITPQGSVCFLSKSWGDRASDKCIIENCGLLLKLLPGDLILADHGFNIQDSVESYCAQVNIPSFSSGKAQLSAVDVETTRKVAHVRTHVERLSGLVRNKYTMLQARLPVDYLIKHDGLPVVDKIVTVACALTNLCDSVVSLI
ncbi:uncharacterized protein LOC119425453 [Nematolebias whitei]|uniref:uncharacterized protein LOC119425453 n=1 Tax=Nematolebias whitei TaxID=451745 RepID=UPI00189B053D|nr:uncharacterized protein LOC119425453 [Nematolebias whitei]